MEKMTAQEIEQKRAGEKETVDCMIGIYCRGVHGTKRGELCEACRRTPIFARKNARLWRRRRSAVPVRCTVIRRRCRRKSVK